MDALQRAQEAVRTAYEAMALALRTWEEADTSADDYDGDALELAYTEARDAHAATCTSLERREALEEAKRALPVPAVDDTPERTPGPAVKSESTLTYERGGFSIFGDLRAAREGDTSARERLERHAREMADSSNQQVADHYAAARGVRSDPWAQQRAITTVDGAGGELVPPLWLQSSWVPLQRAGRPVANSLNMQPLPPKTDTINLPTVSGGTAVAVQTDGNAVTSQDVTTSSVTGAVQTIAGQQDASIQLVDLSIPGIDVVIFDDIARAYATKLDTLVISGAVTNAKGLDQLASTNSVTYTQATPTTATLYPKVADAIQRVHTGRFLPPQVVAMHPVRWASILASLDSQNRPLVVPGGEGFNQAAIFADVASENIVGSIMGLPVLVDASIPTNLGAGTNQDEIFVYRADDLWLYESAPRLRTFEEVLSGTLQVRFQIYGYYALILGRLPKAISKITGTGLVAPTF